MVAGAGDAAPSAGSRGRDEHRCPRVTSGRRLDDVERLRWMLDTDHDQCRWAGVLAEPVCELHRAQVDDVDVESGQLVTEAPVVRDDDELRRHLTVPGRRYGRW